MKKLVVAIDGPAGAGKSTVAQIAAKKLGFTYIDTGAMYRAVAWKTLQQKKEVTDELIVEVVKDIKVRLQYADGATKVFVDDYEVTGEIRTPEINAIVSQVAALGPVREKMVAQQREMAENDSVLMDGRDIATNVLPNADVKIFITAFQFEHFIELFTYLLYFLFSLFTNNILIIETFMLLLSIRLFEQFLLTIPR